MNFGIYLVIGFVYIYIYRERERGLIMEPCRHRCVACFKMFNRRQHLVEHMKISHHSLHQPRCGVCFKHCKSFESVREHLNGIACLILFFFFSYDFHIHLEQCLVSVPDHLFKGDCKSIFSERGCTLCLRIFEDATALADHKNKCHLSAPLPLVSSFYSFLCG